MAVRSSTASLLLVLAFKHPDDVEPELLDELVSRLETGEAAAFEDAIRALVAARLERELG